MFQETSKHSGDFCSLSFLHAFKTKYKLESYKEVCQNEDFCAVLMSDEMFVPYLKFISVPFSIYADLESLIKKIDQCKNNLE